MSYTLISYIAHYLLNGPQVVPLDIDGPGRPDVAVLPRPVDVIHAVLGGISAAVAGVVRAGRQGHKGQSFARVSGPDKAPLCGQGLGLAGVNGAVVGLQQAAHTASRRPADKGVFPARLAGHHILGSLARLKVRDVLLL